MWWVAVEADVAELWTWCQARIRQVVLSSSRVYLRDRMNRKQIVGSDFDQMLLVSLKVANVETTGLKAGGMLADVVRRCNSGGTLNKARHGQRHEAAAVCLVTCWARELRERRRRSDLEPGQLLSSCRS